jgi:hypothetical protein
MRRRKLRSTEQKGGLDGSICSGFVLRIVLFIMREYGQGGDGRISR